MELALQMQIFLIIGATVGHALTPAMFIFGDSLVDAGNNNLLDTHARADHFPYGVNFKGRIATGRFSDGPLISDYIASRLGLNFPSPFLSAMNNFSRLGLDFLPPFLSTMNNFEHGVNFGSASSGIQDQTGIGQHLSLSKQVELFGIVKKTLEFCRKSYIIPKSIFYITTGNNDVNNYLRTSATISSLPQDLQNTLISNFQQQIINLYNFGARKFVVTSLSDVGCIPMNQVASGCSKWKQAVSQKYNVQLRETLDSLQKSLSDVHIVYANLFYLMAKGVESPSLYGLQNSDKPCCPLKPVITNSSTDLFGWCNQGVKYCPKPSKYMYWDLVHFTTAFNKQAAKLFWFGNQTFVDPINIKRLASL